MSEFKKELTDLINKFSKENDSDTPDFILAKYLTSCLVAFNEATVLRDEYFGICDHSTTKPQVKE